MEMQAQPMVRITMSEAEFTKLRTAMHNLATYTETAEDREFGKRFIDVWRGKETE